jgi:hypothetical protein
VSLRSNRRHFPRVFTPRRHDVVVTLLAIPREG